MPIRNSSKALLVREGEILVNRCRSARSGEVYYDLPGGGQRPFETMKEALVREVLEETGYHVRVSRLAAVAEEICLDPAMREKSPEYCHRIAHIFLAELAKEEQASPSEADFGQEGSLWVPLAEADRLPFFPEGLRGRLSALVKGEGPFDLGCSYLR